MSERPKSQLPISRRAEPLDPKFKPHPPHEVRERRTFVIHHYNWAWIILALAVLIRTVAAVI